MDLVGWVEEKRVLSLRALPKPIILRPESMMGFAITREGRVIALPILRASTNITLSAFARASR